MKIGRQLVLATALGALLWFFFAWPLPAHFRAGIPSSNRNLEKFHRLEMIPGDHLQLLYHFQLAGAMLRGRIPAFHNVYEFNTGDDSARFVPDPYYVPFSLVHAALEPALGLAGAWNACGLLSILLTAALTWLLVRRHVDSLAAVVAGTVVGTVFPYRWITLLSGSPTGFGMAFVPAIFLGIDIAVRDGRMRGGVLAGLGLFCAYCTDLHCFYFSALMAPLWALVCLCAMPSAAGEWRARLTGMLKAFLPFVALAGLTVLAAVLVRQGHDAGTDIEHGRMLKDVQRFSPRAMGLWLWEVKGIENHIFFGRTLAGFLLAGGVGAVILLVRDGRRRLRAVVLLGLLLALAVLLIVLSLGTHGPGEGAALKFCRAVLPKYKMIRQPMKVFCLLPTVLALAAALGVQSWLWVLRRGWPVVAAGLLAMAGAFAEYKHHISPTICLMGSEQGAYELVGLDAEGRGVEPRVAVLPLWPGDSHYTSVYQYNVAKYGIRMINGYSPVMAADYVEKVFRRLESLNLGEISDAQFEALGAMRVDYIILHEDVFPGKVSPMPATATLARLAANPRLRFIGADRGAWAFRILAEPAAPPALPDAWQAAMAAWSFDVWTRPAPAVGDGVDIPAACMFHAGYTDLERDAVILRRDAVPDRRVVYLPLLPLPAGRYRVSARWEDDGPRGQSLGYVFVSRDGEELAGAPLIAGSGACEFTFELDGQVSLELCFTFSRAGDVALQAFRLDAVE